MSGGREGAARMQIEGNCAGEGGGGVFSECDTLDACVELAQTALALPLPPQTPAAQRPQQRRPTRGAGGGGAILEVGGNNAAGYGDDFASTPVAMQVEIANTTVVPGVGVLALVVRLEDARGQGVDRGRAPLPYAVVVRAAHDSDSALSLPVPSTPLFSAGLGAVLPSCPAGQ
eukprot:1094202-Rhodomonas_salina.1